MECRNLLKKQQTDHHTKLQFYLTPPVYSISLEQLKTLAIDRLKILRDVESISEDFIKGSKEYGDKLHEKLNKSDFGKSLISYTDNESINARKATIKNDIASHFILQIVYCATDELSRWFISQEMELFKFRFSIENIKNPGFISQFLKVNKINMKKTPESIIVNIQKFYCKDISNLAIYETKAVRVSDLFQKRQVYVKNGTAYLLESNLLSLLSSYFYENLNNSLAFMRLSLSEIHEDGRLLPILGDLNKRFLGKDYSLEPTTTITAAQVPILAKKSFPPCMQKVQTVLAREHHLKHWARMQYGLFLKGIGLPLDESIKFWRSSFEPVTNSELFGRRYAYSIRHNYGQEGKRVSYTPYSCQKIITSNLPQAGDCHGCPFQQPEAVKLLVQNLRSTTRATPEQLDTITTKAQQNHFQISCRNYFRLVHGLPDDYAVSINHPNEYFEESQKVVGVATKTKEE